jgi:hypothetical protein
MSEPNRVVRLSGSVLFLLLVAAAAEAAPTWPSSDSSWTAFQSGSSPLTDPTNDVNPESIDVVGSSSYPAGYWYEDISSWSDDYVMFRMRTSADGTSGNYAWQVMLDLDTDSDIDWVLQLNQSGSTTGVFLSQATTGGTQFKDVVLAGTPAWNGAISTYSRWVSTGANNFGNGTDYFLDLAVPWATLMYTTGIMPGGAFRIGLSTSTTHQGINKDFPINLSSTSNVSGGWTDTMNFSSQHNPEPGTLLLTGFGIAGTFLARRRLARKKKGAAGSRAPRI